MADQPFSQRYGYRRPSEIVREDAPSSLRSYIVETARQLGCNLETLRSLICRRLRKLPNLSNCGDSKISGEIDHHLSYCAWFEVYDVIQDIYKWLSGEDQADGFAINFFRPTHAAQFSNALNEFFLEEGIGWQIVEGQVLARADETSDKAVKSAISQLSENGRPTAARHIESAVKALSARPRANAPGAWLTPPAQWNACCMTSPVNR